MPQVWLTYQEMGDELGCDAFEARETAAARSWTRKRSRDGMTRVLLPQEMLQAYFTSRALAPQAQPARPPVAAMEQLRRVWGRGAASYRM